MFIGEVKTSKNIPEHYFSNKLTGVDPYIPLQNVILPKKLPSWEEFNKKKMAKLYIKKCKDNFIAIGFNLVKRIKKYKSKRKWRKRNH